MSSLTTLNVYLTRPSKSLPIVVECASSWFTSAKTLARQAICQRVGDVAVNRPTVLSVQQRDGYWPAHPVISARSAALDTWVSVGRLGASDG